MWTKVESIDEIPIGDWLVIMEGEERGYLSARKGANCIFYIINSHFHFDMNEVVAYMPFPEYKGEEQ